MQRERLKLRSETRNHANSKAADRSERRGRPRFRDDKGRVSGGNPGNKGGGRKPERFIRLCQDLSFKAMKLKVRRVLKNQNHPHFVQALKLAAQYGFGMPKQSIDVTGHVTLEQLVAGSYTAEPPELTRKQLKRDRMAKRLERERRASRAARNSQREE